MKSASSHATPKMTIPSVRSESQRLSVEGWVASPSLSPYVRGTGQQLYSSNSLRSFTGRISAAVNLPVSVGVIEDEDAAGVLCGLEAFLKRARQALTNIGNRDGSADVHRRCADVHRDYLFRWDEDEVLAYIRWNSYGTRRREFVAVSDAQEVVAVAGVPGCRHIHEATGVPPGGVGVGIAAIPPQLLGVGADRDEQQQNYRRRPHPQMHATSSRPRHLAPPAVDRRKRLQRCTGCRSARNLVRIQ